MKVIILLLLSIGILHAQDTIVTKKGETIIANIVQLDSSVIRFEKNVDDGVKLRSISTTDVVSIHFALGSDNASGANLSWKARSHLNDSLYLKGQIDAIQFYNGYHDAAMVTLATSLLSPFAGLIPAVGFTESNIKPANLNCPNLELYTTNIGYYRGYTDRAKKIRNGKVVRNWFIGFGVNVVAVLIILSSRH